ncbi:C39 family peptidase [Wansuia hejianensis]|uniref:C39 family peptidase n=1 Tax=Wansuia hejianensis TaxID=2763667 RepID=A0A7G9GBW5_9FIRM|nr:C39 family peptidase [Wansuia hejianensis]QNM08297.1 C39 family peptidase [Wansuia hejianensis]RHV84539.1 hypothetical protein DXA96_18795 [Lachnospiraceae bacterium OF09-33XD]
MNRLRKKIIWMVVGTSLPALLLFVLIAATMAVSLVSIGSKQETEKLKRTTSSDGYLTGLGNGMDGLTPFSYFCIYEGGAELYNSVMGDGGRGCGAYGFDYEYDLQPFLDYCYQYNTVKYGALYPYTSAQIAKENLYGNQNLADAWRAVYAADPTDFSRRQDTYVYDTKYLAIEAYHKARGLDLSGRPDVIKGLCTSIHNRKGMETSRYSYITQSGVSNEMSDEEFITKLCDSFGTRGGYIYERYCVDYSSGACGLLCEKNMALAILHGNYGNSSGNVGAEVINHVPYYNQGDYGHIAFNSGTVKSDGCGIVSFSMVASYFLNQNITPEETAPWAMGNGANTVTNWGAYAILASHYGITLESQKTGPLYGGSSVPIIQALQQGKLVIASHTGGYLNPSGSGHYVVYTGITNNGKITVNDPGDRAKTQESADNGGFDQTSAFSHCKQYWIFSR